MNILLIIPKFFINLREPTHFPTGMALVSASLKGAGNAVTILNLNFIDSPLEQTIKEYIDNNNIKLVMTGGLVTDYCAVERIASTVKRINQDIPVSVGGGLITCAPELVLGGLKDADFGVFGEGEITSCELVKALEMGTDLSQIDGVVFKKNGVPIKNKARAEIKNLDECPRPDYEGFELGKLLDLAPKRYITMSTGRSCAFNCTFCFHTSGKTYRQRSLDSFFEELDYLVDQYKVDNLYVTDELFAINRERLEEFCSRIKKYNILWAVQLRVEIVSKDLLQLLKDSGCIIISLGLESADNRVLKSMRKKITIEQIEAALKNCFEVGIQANGNFIFGDIAEDTESVRKTLAWWSDHRQYNISLALIQVYPGTYLYQYAVGKGIIKDELEFIRQGCPYINLSQLTDEQYRELGVSIYNNFARDEDYLLQPKIEFINYKKSRMDISGHCAKCGTENLFREVYMTLPVNRVCKNCGHVHTVNPYEIRRSEANLAIEELLKTHKQIAFYGVGKVLKSIFDQVPALNNENSIVIDNNNIIQGAIFAGRHVHHPDILNETGIRAVIICDYIFTMLLDTQLRDYYPQVLDRINCFDVLHFNSETSEKVFDLESKSVATSSEE